VSYSSQVWSERWRWLYDTGCFKIQDNNTYMYSYTFTNEQSSKQAFIWALPSVVQFHCVVIILVFNISKLAVYVVK